MSQKTISITGWALTGILGIFIIMSASMKLIPNETTLAQASAFGMNASTYRIIGIIEITSLLLFIFQRTGILGTLLLIAYFGGAIVTHLQHDQSVTIAVLFQVTLWITAFLRFPELRKRLITSH